jgi:hypothetical protein
MSDTTTDGPELPPAEQLHYDAVQYLLDGHEEDAASVLLSCNVKMEATRQSRWDTDWDVTARMTGPREAYDILSNRDHDTYFQVLNAFNAVMPWGYYMEGIYIRVASTPVPPDWRTELLEIARGTGVHNQLVADTTVKAIIQTGMRYRSRSEAQIALALDRAGVMYLPNCKARLGSPTARQNKEPDFLICHEGKWGILEVDGEPFHPPSRTVQDHERDQFFYAHGVRVVRHYDATRCFRDSDGVVKEFISNLVKLG